MRGTVGLQPSGRGRCEVAALELYYEDLVGSRDMGVRSGSRQLDEKSNLLLFSFDQLSAGFRLKSRPSGDLPPLGAGKFR